MPGARPRAQRTVHRGGRFGRRLGQAGPRPPIRRSCRCAARSSTSSACGSKRCSSSQEIADVDHGARDGRRRTKRHRASFATTRVVIMTDADVDGSHIRTLLLTLFFRQFVGADRERLPLHRAAATVPAPRRGKQERYLKDEIALEDYLTRARNRGADVPGWQEQGDARAAWRAAQDDGAQGAGGASG